MCVSITPTCASLYTLEGLVYDFEYPMRQRAHSLNLTWATLYCVLADPNFTRYLPCSMVDRRSLHLEYRSYLVH